MSGLYLLFAFSLAIILLIFMISKLKIHAFIALMLIAFTLALVSDIPIVRIPMIIGEGFSGIFKSIGIVIIFGTLIGLILQRSGAALKLVDVVAAKAIDKRPNLAMLIMGYVVGIPVFCDSGYVVLNPIRKALACKIRSANPVGMAVALSAGLYISHVLIPPTPGPIVAAGNVGLANHLFLIIILGFLVSIPALFVAYLFSKYIDKKMILEKDKEEIQKSYDELKKEFGKLPSLSASIMPIVLPIILMAMGSIVNLMSYDNAFVFIFLGSPVVALFIGVLCGVYLLMSVRLLNKFSDITEESLKIVGPIILITAAGGVLGKVIVEAKIVEFIKENASVIKSFGIFFPFAIACILKSAQGSSTVAITTTASILGSYNSDGLMHVLGLSTQIGAALSVMAIGFGAMCVSHANDSYFWVVTNCSGLSTSEGYKTQTILTLLMGITGMITIFILSIFCL